MHSSLIKKKFKVMTAFVIVCLAAMAMVSSSYAWLAISRTPIVSDLDLTVMTESRLEIAPDVNGQPGEWDVVLDLSSFLEDVVPLKPVTFSKINQVLYTPLYDVDGRSTGLTVALSDEVNANVKKGDQSAYENGYYIAVTFWVRGAQNAAISLSSAKEIDEGLAGSGTYVIGNPVWNGEVYRHTNGGNGLETALRIGFRCQNTTLDGQQIDETRFVIYEPNSDMHYNGAQGYVETTSLDGGLLVEEADLIRQTASTWDETNPILKDTVVYSLGTFENSSKLFEITPHTMEKVTMYVWLEGRDMDCINQLMAAETSIKACIQLTANDGYNDTGITRD